MTLGRLFRCEKNGLVVIRQRMLPFHHKQPQREDLPDVPPHRLVN